VAQRHLIRDPGTSTHHLSQREGSTVL
jgi:hypothetical protein